LNRYKLTLISAAIGVAVSATAMGDVLSESQYRTGKDNISTRHQSDQAACESMAGNAKDVCGAEANGREAIARAELEVAYAPSAEHRYEASIARANAAYAVANAKCDEFAGNTQDVCRKEAKSAEVAAKADAGLTQKTGDANATASEANTAAAGEAATKKHDAAYAVAKEKCDSLADGAQATCIAEARKVHGQI
jgi:hypothetical protein